MHCAAGATETCIEFVCPLGSVFNINVFMVVTMLMNYGVVTTILYKINVFIVVTTLMDYGVVMTI